MKIASFFVGLSVCVATTAIAAPFQSPSGYRISPPPGFVLRPNTSASGQLGAINIKYQATDALFVGPRGASLTIIAKELPASFPLPLLLQVMVTQLDGASTRNAKLSSGVALKHPMTIHVLSKGYTSVDGVKAIFITSRMDFSTPKKGISRSVVALRGKRMWVFGCTANASDWARESVVFNRSLASVRWTK